MNGFSVVLSVVVSVPAAENSEDAERKARQVVIPRTSDAHVTDVSIDNTQAD